MTNQNSRSYRLGSEGSDLFIFLLNTILCPNDNIMCIKTYKRTEDLKVKVHKTWERHHEVTKEADSDGHDRKGNRNRAHQDGENTHLTAES